ncbi:hypothetical protein H310_09370 [Aphanomyces invadans]|uniref:CRAL-TRIO domain-containing protein n=1 Tax=Aphanomyces invadans TaxID=157072 RepID=A0A024TXL2_9STRA|nr:hypothetical protein H310_09370 [Aphanomyces invadans]ETV98087.1 hypothetical protein H310_09370 [Aphanomyces invadans]RHY34518.1 hypothetical protein DYB32_000895 [Aphanomyces invadans]|eukprot:XP_008873648.1 hypothetical protein H310_09370 [Aphanomyces invadans]
MRGKVLLRASEYQWISRVMVLEVASLSFFCPKSQCSLECVQLRDATCETVVVSSDHLHCFRVIEVDDEHHATKEWIIDVASSQVKQKWISAIQTNILELKRVRCPAKDVAANSAKEAPVTSLPADNMDRIDTARRLIHDLQTQRGSVFLRGKDVLDILQKHIGIKSRTEAVILGNTLLNEGYFKHMVSQYTLLDDDCLFETVSRTQVNLQKQFHTMPDADDGDDEVEQSLQNQSNGYYCPELHNLFVSMLSEIEISYVVDDPRPNEDLSISAVDLDRSGLAFDAAKELTLKECIYGTDAVECLMNAGLLNEDAAVVLGNQLLARGYFSPMDNDTDSFENARKRYVLSSSITRSVAPTAEETLMEIQCQEEKYRQDLVRRDDLRIHGMQLLAASFLVILLLDSLQSMSLGLKLLLVAFCVGGKMYFHDPLITAAAPAHLPAKLTAPTKKPKTKRMTAPSTTSVDLPSPNQLRNRKNRAGETPIPSTTASSTWSDSGSPTTIATTEPVVSLTADELARVASFRTMLSITDENSFLFKDDYLYSVLNVRNRTMTYAAEKLQRCIAWRQSYGAATITMDEILPQLSNCSFYWFGYDYHNRPIIWTRPKLKNWGKMDTALEIRAHVFMIELGIKHLMPPGVTTFTLVTDCRDVGYREVDIRLMKGLMEVCSGNYPDRIGAICIGPLTTLVKTLTRMLSPLLPVRLREKAKFMKHPGKELEEFMAPQYVPKYMGGEADHPLSQVPGEFDFQFMLTEQRRRLERLSQQAAS